MAQLRYGSLKVTQSRGNVVSWIYVLLFSSIRMLLMDNSTGDNFLRYGLLQGIGDVIACSLLGQTINFTDVVVE